MPLCIHFPHWIGLTCVTRILRKWWCVTSRTRSYKALWLLLALSWIALSDGSQLSCHVGTPTVLLRGPWGEGLRPPATCWPREWATLELDPPATVRPSDDCTHIWLQPCEIPTQLSCSPTPDTQTLHEIIMFGMGTSLVVQWLRIHLPIQGTRVQALVWEDPTWRGATKPVHHNYWACALEPVCHNYWSPHA